MPTSIKGGSAPSQALTANTASAEIGVSSNFGGTVTANTGNVGKKKKAIVSSFLVGANTNNPTLTVRLYGSTDGTNFTELGNYTLPKNDSSVTKAVAKVQSFDLTGDHTYFRVTGSGVVNGTTYGYGVTIGVI